MSDLALAKSLKAGWQAFKRYWLFFIGLSVLIFLLGLLPRLLEWLLQDAPISGFLIFLAYVTTWVVQTLVGMGSIRIALTVVDGNTPAYRQLLSEHRKLFRYIAVNFLVGIIVFVGLLLFIIPGVIWALKYQFATYLIIDRNQSVFQAIHNSGNLTKGHKWQLFLLAIIYFLINILGVLALGIGLVVAMPVVFISITHIYRQLLEQATKHKSPSAPDPNLPPNVSPGLATTKSSPSPTNASDQFGR